MKTHILERLNKLTNWQAAIIIAVVGFAVFAVGLNNQFEGDDFGQIVGNTTIQSLSNVGKFFTSGTYKGATGGTLSGTYYRPLMTTFYSIIDVVFGQHPFFFHLIQLLIYIAGAIILYLFFRYSFKPALALFLSLLFLIHPINSQVAYAIPNLQDALFFFFGILALYLLLRFKLVMSLAFVGLCLFLSLLAKESGLLFVVTALVYLFWWDRKRFVPLLGIIFVPVSLWLILRINAVGVFSDPVSGPIDRLGLTGRLFTAPSIIPLYFEKLIFPWKLASTYYWTYPTFSFSHFILPLMFDVLLCAVIVYMALVVRKKAPKPLFYTFLFFTTWAALGVGLLLQIVPLDMTASEAWFYFPMAGILGMLGVALTVFPMRINPNYLLILAIIILALCGLRTSIRGLDWRSQYQLAKVDIANSQDNSRAYSIIVYTLMQQGKFAEARPYQEAALRIYPSFGGYENYAKILIETGDYSSAVIATKQSIAYGNRGINEVNYERLGYLALLTGSENDGRNNLTQALRIYPGDSVLWIYLALLDEKYSDNPDAKVAITNAAAYGQVSPVIYDNIMENRAFSITITGKTIELPHS